MLKDIQTKKDYIEYESRIENFMKVNNIKIEPNPVSNLPDGDYEPFFSWHSCDSCQRPLGGDRYECNAVDFDDNILEFNICSDCFYYFAYGRLDDLTMMTIEQD